MILQIAAGIMLGALAGAWLGRAQSCQTGACPLTANPRRGAVWGGLMGLALALTLGLTGPPAEGSRSASGAPAKVAAAAGPVTEVTGADQFQQLLAGPGRLVVDFYATWCPPCRLYSPRVEKVAGEGLPGVRFARIDVDRVKALAGRYGVEALPTTIVFEHGQPTESHLGLLSESALRKLAGAGS